MRGVKCPWFCWSPFWMALYCNTLGTKARIEFFTRMVEIFLFNVIWIVLHTSLARYNENILKWPFFKTQLLVYYYLWKTTQLFASYCYKSLLSHVLYVNIVDKCAKYISNTCTQQPFPAFRFPFKVSISAQKLSVNFQDFSNRMNALI